MGNKRSFKQGLSRRSFLKSMAAATGGAVAYGMPFVRVSAQAGGTIDFWTQPYGDAVAWQELMQGIANNFANESGHEVRVEILPWDAAFNTWLLVAQGGEHPDIADMFWLHSHAAIGAGQNGPLAITDVQDQLFPDLEERFFAGALQDVFYLGDFYGIPWRGDVRPQMYRVDYFEEAGIDHAPDTWDEIVEMGKELTIRENGETTRWGFAFGGGGLQPLWPLYWQAGGEFMSEDGSTATIDNDAMRESLNFMRSLVWEHQIVSPDFLETSYNGIDLFRSGSVAIVGSVPDNNAPVNVRDFPELDGLWAFEVPAMGPVNRASYSGAGYWGLLNGTERIEESLEWLSFLARDETMQTITEVQGGVSANKSVMASDFWTDADWKLKVVESLDHAHTSQHPSPAWSTINSNTPGGILYDLYFDAVVLQEDLDEVIATTQAKMQVELDKAFVEE